MSETIALEVKDRPPEKHRIEADIYKSEAAEVELEGDLALAEFFRDRAKTLEQLADSRKE